MTSGQWGSYANSAANSVLWGVVNAKLSTNSVNRDAFFENTTPSAYITGVTLGQFGVEPSQMQVYNGPIDQVTITSVGSGYNANSLSSISGGGGSGANVSFTQVGGRLTSYTINNGGSSYETSPTITIYPPAIITINGNTAVSGDTITLSNANSYFLVNDGLTVSANATSTPGGLTSGRSYIVVLANTTSFKLSTTQGGTPITLTKASGDNTTAGGFGLIGDTATAVAITGGALHKGVAHSGWVVRKVGSGGRAGRVQYETLVASGTLQGTIDAVANTVLPSQNT